MKHIAFEGYLVDLHLESAFVEDPHRAVEPLRFLFDPASYEKYHRKKERFTRAGYSISPGKQRTIDDFFWKAVTSCWAPAPAGADGRKLWGLQIPFLFTPDESRVLFRHEVLGNWWLDLAIHVWSTGWSTSLRLRDEDGDFDQMGQVLGAMRSREERFNYDGKALHLSGLFQLVTKRLTSALCPGGEYGQMTLRIPRLATLGFAIGGSRGTPSYKAMAAAERRTLLSLLHGPMLSLERLFELERGSLTVSPMIIDDDFAVISFDHGVAASLSSSLAARSGAGLGWFRCLVSNLRSCMLYGESVGRLVADSDNPADAGSPLDTLAVVGRRILERLPSRYANPFCAAYYRNNSEIRGAVRQRSSSTQDTQSRRHP